MTPVHVRSTDMFFENCALKQQQPDLSGFVVEEKTPDLEQQPRTRRKKREAIADSREEAKRTVFIGNLPLGCSLVPSSEKQLRKWIDSHCSNEEDSPECIRFRRPIVYDKSGALISRPDLKLLHQSSKLRKQSLEDGRASITAYVVMRHISAATELVRKLPREYEGRHLRVDVALGSPLPSHKRCLFLGNLPKDLQEEELWSALHDSLSDPNVVIQSVRILRDKNSSVGKGIGYVAFQERASVRTCLDRFSKKNPLSIKGRIIRLEKCKPNP
jgi:RNA recognition motif-containing protein